jgi:AcrR family transcriptional regulator
VSGLRQLRMERTREAIQREALRLIAAQGYDGTTCEQVAAAAEVSPATLFRYFPTKEDLVLHDVYDPMIADAVRARPPRESGVTAVRRALVDVFADIYDVDLEHVRQRTALIFSVPALKARSLEQQQSLVAHLVDALAERAGSSRDDVAVEVTASACAAALGVAVGRWVRHGGDLRVHVDEAMAALGTLARRVSR